MTAPPPPTIFSTARRDAARLRAARRQRADDAPRYLFDHVAEDMQERLAFLRHDPGRMLVLGDLSGTLARSFAGRSVVQGDPAPVEGRIRIDPESPIAGPFDTIAVVFVLEAVNDVPGALVHLRAALAQGGLMIAGLVGAGSLGTLRAIMLAADAERPAARIHPQIDVAAGAALLQRAGFASPVADSHPLRVRYRSLATMADDLRAHGMVNQLASPAPPLDRAAWARAKAAFAERSDGTGVLETFELVTLSGWRVG